MYASFMRAVFGAGGLPAWVLAVAAVGQAAAGEPVAAERLIHWEFLQEISVQPAPDAPLADVVLTPSVFDAARLDLADLRLFDARDREVPYALRVRRPEDATEVVAAEEFNRTEGPDQTSLLSLDLGEARIEHNEIEIPLEGQNFRRRALVEGSDDAETWSRMAERNLLRFQVENRRLTELTVRYSPSRYRYLRLTVWPDPQVDQEPVEIGSVVVRRRVRLPGEFTRREAALGDRQAVPADRGPGSAWTIDLGGRDVPCSRLRVDVADAEFVRDWYLEAGGPPETREPFRRIGGGTWRRRAGEAIEPMVAEFPEMTAARLRLVVTDHRNPPLLIRRVVAEAAARTVIFPVGELPEGPVRLYFGNPHARAPFYDFARNLPPRLEPPPRRLELGPRRHNPVFQPEPLPLTERWPWLIYVLLGLAVGVLGLLIVNLARTTIELADARCAAAS